MNSTGAQHSLNNSAELTDECSVAEREEDQQHTAADDQVVEQIPAEPHTNLTKSNEPRDLEGLKPPAESCDPVSAHIHSAHELQVLRLSMQSRNKIQRDFFWCTT
jgi:hypothetical protein